MCAPTYLFDTKMTVYKCGCVCVTVRVLDAERVVVAVKCRTLFNLKLQSLAGFLSVCQLIIKSPHGRHTHTLLGFFLAGLLPCLQFLCES